MSEQLLGKSLNIKECKRLEIQITQNRHPDAFQMEQKMSKFNTPQNWENGDQMCTQ